MKTKFENLLSVVRQERKMSDPIPLYEHFVDDEIIDEVMGFVLSEGSGGLTTLSGAMVSDSEMPANIEYWKKKIQFFQQMGYGYISVEFPPLFSSAKTKKTSDPSISSRGNREWVDEHSGSVHSIDDLDDEIIFPPLEKIYDFRLFNAISEIVPEDMKIIGGFAGGPFEHGCYLLGLNDYLTSFYENEELIDRLHEKLKAVFIFIAGKIVCIKNLAILRIGDDLGFKHSTLISPDLLKKYILPAYKDVVNIAHKNNKPFILHSCGDLQNIMDDLIDTCKIDAKHSNEDVILPFEKMVDRWGNRIALLGGMDVDFLARENPIAIKEKVKRIMEKCLDKNVAIGSGNTISNYIPVKNYVAMIEAVQEFNGM